MRDEHISRIKDGGNKNLGVVLKDTRWNNIKRDDMVGVVVYSYYITEGRI